MNRFKDQTAIIVGGARGIGKAIAKRLFNEGAEVTVFDVLKGDFPKLENNHRTINTTIVDITDEVTLNKAVKNVIDNNNRLDILVNCAGIIGPSSTKIMEYELKDFQKVMDVNLTGAFIVTKAVLPQMCNQKYGRILHLASIGGKEGNPGMVGYASSKSGLMGLVKGVGKEYADSGITVNGIAPAVIATPMNEDTAPEMLQYMTSKIPMGRLGTTDEVAAMACWIVSKEASFNTGYVFDLSGGRATY
ncbi:SDR family NAD(P)-dependent oxidoreductase [Ulvibacterium marinum]|uniref:SDR family oxidoreductase n=1 Tax=Ulvibacterium marinum TaxID=2419782 RepID=A0A3B0BZN8_9FLAO|nr:SDR family NAD(P)-dependent oxidoreductase [Ulvibacterium marinum]RKN78802.1 SDR family oxidoreductase [Ulvibacterium marinum]